MDAPSRTCRICWASPIQQALPQILCRWFSHVKTLRQGQVRKLPTNRNRRYHLPLSVEIMLEIVVLNYEYSLLSSSGEDNNSRDICTA